MMNLKGTTILLLWKVLPNQTDQMVNFTPNMKIMLFLMQYALLLRYTSLQSYKLLLDEFPLPSISLLNKIKEGNIDALKAAKLLLENSSISKDIVVLFDEMYLQKCVEYCGGDFFGSNINNELYKSIVCFMIIGLKENVPYVVKAAPVTFINNELLKDELLNCLELLITGGFNVRAVICDNHAANVSAFTKLILQFGEDNESLFINFQSLKVYLFYDTVHLIKNVRNNLFSKKRLVFPQFSFFEFNDDVIVNPGEISWKLLYDVHEKDQKFGGQFQIQKISIVLVIILVEQLFKMTTNLDFCAKWLHDLKNGKQQNTKL